MDRTFTGLGLELAPEAVARARALRSRGVVTILATGRPEAEVPLDDLAGCFDALVLEGGPVVGQPGATAPAAAADGLGELAHALRSAGHDVRMARASLSAAAGAEDDLRRLAGPAWTWHRNLDRIDITPAGWDKGTGLRHALAILGVRDPWVLAVGDSANDVPLFAAADASVAVANAVPALAARATAVAPLAAAQGFLWAVGGLP